MEKVEFTEDSLRVMHDAGLKTFEDFFGYSSGEVINRNNKRNVTVMDIPFGSQQKRFYMKRYIKPHFKDMFFTWCNFGRVCSQARLEWLCANTLLKNGIDTYRPACYGEQTVLGIERHSFFVTEQIEGVCLSDYVSRNWSGLKQEAKEKLMASLGMFVRSIHDARISMPDLYVWHIFITNAEEIDSADDYNFAVIDLHRMKLDSSSLVERGRNLAAFDYSMSEKYFTRHDREVFIEAYFMDMSPVERERITKIQDCRTKVIRKRRGQPQY